MGGWARLGRHWDKNPGGRGRAGCGGCMGETGIPHPHMGKLRKPMEYQGPFTQIHHLSGDGKAWPK